MASDDYVIIHPDLSDWAFGAQKDQVAVARRAETTLEELRRRSVDLSSAAFDSMRKSFSMLGIATLFLGFSLVTFFLIAPDANESSSHAEMAQAPVERHDQAPLESDHAGSANEGALVLNQASHHMRKLTVWMSSFLVGVAGLAFVILGAMCCYWLLKWRTARIVQTVTQIDAAKRMPNDSDVAIQKLMSMNIVQRVY